MLDTVKQLKELLGAEFAVLVEAYDVDNRAHLLSAKQAIEAQDGELLRRHIHSIKGASANIGADELANRCQLLETKGKLNEFDGTVALLSEIEQLFEQAVSTLKSQ